MKCAEHMSSIDRMWLNSQEVWGYCELLQSLIADICLHQMQRQSLCKQQWESKRLTRGSVKDSFLRITSSVQCAKAIDNGLVFWKALTSWQATIVLSYTFEQNNSYKRKHTFGICRHANLYLMVYDAPCSFTAPVTSLIVSSGDNEISGYSMPHKLYSFWYSIE